MYPIKIKMKHAYIDELQACESGFYEDWSQDKTSYKGTPAFLILERSKTHVIINDRQELDHFCDFVSIGTFGLHPDDRGCPDHEPDYRELMNQYRAANRFFDRLKEIRKEIDG